MTDKVLEEFKQDYDLDETTGNDTAGQTMLGSELTANSHDTIQFISAGAQPPVEYDYKGISKLMVDVTADDTHTIKDFLARPVAIGTVDLGSAGGTGQDIFTASILDKIFSNATIGDKLANFFAMRCTFCTKIVLNSQPYQSGIFYFSQRPYQEEYIGDNQITHYWPAYAANIGIEPKLLLPHLTGFPGIMLNISAVSEETIKVPYIGVTPSINLAAAFGNQVALTIVSPLAQNDNGPHAYATVYAWLEDVELIGTDPYRPKAQITLIPQSGKHVEKLIRGQSPPQSAEAERGTVSKVADTVGGIAKTLSRIPVVADIAGPVSWACDAVSGLGSIFGFSKPNDPKHAKPMTIDPFRMMPSCDMPNTATKLTVTKNAEIATDSLGPTDEDEMNISKIAARPCVYDVITWKTDQTRGTKLGTWRMNPSYFYREQETQQGSITQRLNAWTFLGWLSRLFLFWRGSLQMTYVFAATQFHSGRLRLVVTINHSSDLTATNFDDPGHYSLIYDLRAGDTFAVEVPFLSYNYWRRCALDADEKDVVLDLFVEGQLVADGRAASFVQIAVLPSAGDDIAFTAPKNEKHGLAQYHAFSGNPAEAEWVLTPQGFDTLSTAQKHQEIVSMYPRPPEHANVVANTQAFGDPITSLRTLSKRYALKAQVKPTTKAIMGVIPFLRNLRTDSKYSTYLATIREPFRFVRGGIRLLFTGLSTSIKPIQFKLIRLSQAQNITASFTIQNGVFTTVEGSGIDWNDLESICEVVAREDIRGNLEVEIPYYSQYAMLDNMPIDVPETTHLDFGHFPRACATDIALVWDQEGAATINVYESAADDFSCGYLVGPPVWSEILGAP